MIYVFDAQGLVEVHRDGRCLAGPPTTRHGQCVTFMMGFGCAPPAGADGLAAEEPPPNLPRAPR